MALFILYSHFLDRSPFHVLTALFYSITDISFLRLAIRIWIADSLSMAIRIKVLFNLPSILVFETNSKPMIANRYCSLG
jgi:hypothetical protein